MHKKLTQEIILSTQSGQPHEKISDIYPFFKILLIFYIVITFAHTTLFHKYTGVFGFAVNEQSNHKTSIHKSSIKSLKGGLKSALFAHCSVTFRHQYHTLDMARYLDMNVGVQGNISTLQRFNTPLFYSVIRISNMFLYHIKYHCHQVAVKVLELSFL